MGKGTTQAFHRSRNMMSANIWKSVQHHKQLEKCKSQLHWGCSLPQSEWQLSRMQATINVDKDVGKRYTHMLLVGLQIGTSTLENSREIPQKTQNGTTIWLSHPTPWHIFKGSKPAYYSDLVTSMCIAVQFTRAKLWNQPRCPSTDEQTKKMWYTYTIKYKP